MLTILFVISVVVNLGLAWAVFNLLRKIEEFEEYFESLHAGLSSVFNQIRDIDIRGSFEADDEVGLVYSVIRGLVLTLEDFIIKEHGTSQEN